MCKWMSDEFQDEMEIKTSISKEFQKLGLDYQNLKDETELPNFLKELIDFWPKASKIEKIIIGILEPQISLSIEYKETDKFIERCIKHILSINSSDNNVLSAIMSFGIPNSVCRFYQEKELEDDSKNTNDNNQQ